MPKRTEPTPSSDSHRDDEPNLPQPSSVLAEPATIAACARDYAANAHVRADFNKQQQAG